MTRTIKRLALSWSTSRGNETYGYPICRLDDTQTGARFRCMGGGYDMMGTVFAEWLAANYQPELKAIKSRANGIYAREHGYKPADSESSLYGMTYYEDGDRVGLDGACGLDCMIRIAKAIGLRVERDYIATGRRRGETIGWYVGPADKQEAAE